MILATYDITRVFRFSLYIELIKILSIRTPIDITIIGIPNALQF